MAFVIAQACIGVKDTACVDACPVDSIHALADSPQFYIEPSTCIDCAACESACPVKAIYPGDQVPASEQKFIAINADFFKGFDKSKSASYTLKKTERKAEGTAEGNSSEAGISPTTANWVEKSGWEAEWEKNKDISFDRKEEQKRYGRVHAVFEQADRYVMRFYLPEHTPNHPFTFKFGLPREMSTYEMVAELKGNKAIIRGKIIDPSIAKLAGHANSFPDRFYQEYTFPKPVTSISVSPQGKHVVDVVVLKTIEQVKAA